MTTLENLLAQARARQETRTKLAALEQEQQEEEDRRLTEQVDAALENILRADDLIATAQWEAAQRTYEPRVRVTLELADHQMVPITFDLEYERTSDRWRLRTEHHRMGMCYEDGFRVMSAFQVDWDHMLNCWQVHGMAPYITTDLIEALMYAMDGWPAYAAAHAERARREESGETPWGEEEPQTPAEQLIAALAAFIDSRRFEF
jgi:hypothetical protein